MVFCGVVVILLPSVAKKSHCKRVLRRLGCTMPLISMFNGHRVPQMQTLLNAGTGDKFVCFGEFCESRSIFCLELELHVKVAIWSYGAIGLRAWSTQAYRSPALDVSSLSSRNASFLIACSCTGASAVTRDGLAECWLCACPCRLRGFRMQTSRESFRS